MKEKKMLTFMIIAITAITIGIVAISLSLRGFNASDTAGIIVATLTTLVVMLIGWQIYTVVDMKDKMKEFDTKVAAYAFASDLLVNKLSAEIYATLSELYMKNGSTSDVYEHFNYSLLAVLHANKANNFGFCNVMLKSLNGHFPVNAAISANSKALLLSLIIEIKRTNKGELIGLDDLHNNIILMKIE